MCAALIERDDEWDRGRRGASAQAMSASLADALSPGDLLAETRWDPVLADIWRSFADYLPPPQIMRFQTGVAQFIQGCITYDMQLIKQGMFVDVEVYLAAQDVTLGNNIDQIMVEISLEIDLAQVLDDSAIQAIKKCDNDRVLLWHDLLSLNKELSSGEHDENDVPPAIQTDPVDGAVNLSALIALDTTATS
jgi:hypothetical protein